MSLMIQGQLVECIVVHGSELTLWELPTGGGAGLSIAMPLELSKIIESIKIDIDTVHSMEPYGTKGIATDTVQIFINDEEAV